MFTLLSDIPYMVLQLAFCQDPGISHICTSHASVCVTIVTQESERYRSTGSPMDGSPPD